MSVSELVKKYMISRVMLKSGWNLKKKLEI